MEPANKLAGKRKSFTVEQKVKFIKLIESREQQQIDVAKTFNVKPSTLSKIYKDLERILDEWNRGCIAKKHFKSSDNEHDTTPMRKDSASLWRAGSVISINT